MSVNITDRIIIVSKVCTKVADVLEKPVAVDDVIASLQGLTVKSKSKDGEDTEASLTVEPAKSISQIENAGMAAV